MTSGLSASRSLAVVSTRLIITMLRRLFEDQLIKHFSCIDFKQRRCVRCCGSDIEIMRFETESFSRVKAGMF